MSTATVPASELASEDWQLTGKDDSKATSLLVQLRRRAYVLPYFRLVCAEGDDSQVKIAFASHLVTVTGHGLAALLEALATQRVVRVVAPTENEAKFGVRGVSAMNYTGPSITAISVEQPE
jgi:hypothetical protein